MDTTKVKGVLCGILAAITYGSNPLGALNLYAAGINPDSVLFYRYGLSVAILGIIMLIRKTSFRIQRKELIPVSVLGIIFAISSLTLFMSFKYMDAGIASTILFIYPIIVSAIMTFFFKEKLTLTIIISTALALSGVALLYHPQGGKALNTVGVLLVVFSSISYATYIVMMNKSDIKLSPIKMTFYTMIFGTLTIAIHALSSPSIRIQPLTSWSMWGWASMLAVFPTVISLVLTVVAVKEIGSTNTAIMGALEPVTALSIGITIFHEAFSIRLAWGIVMILSAVTLVIISEPVGRKIKQQRMMRKKESRF